MSTTSVDLHSHGEHGHGHRAHDPHHQHHFTTMEQQFDTAKIGMWLFLVTEVLLFGGLFVGFGMMQARYAHEFKEAHEHLQRGFGAFNTVVLLVSSWTMVLAVNAARSNKRERCVLFLGLTIACACAFLGVKYFEYSHKYHEGLLPGLWYSHTPLDTIQNTFGYRAFFSFYFMMTGLHGLHILGGIVALTWILLRAKKGEFSSAYYTPVDLVGLYWHIVDMIWIYLFPLYYLIS